MTSTTNRTPGARLLIAIIVAAVLTVPLMLVYALVYDRETQSQTARASITQGWGGPQIVGGPVLMIPYTAENIETVVENGKSMSRAVRTERELFLSPVENTAEARLSPEQRSKSIYVTVLYNADIKGRARFALPADLERYGVTREQLALDRAEIRFGVSDARGLRSGSRVTLGGRSVELLPGKGLAATGNVGFFAFAGWDGAAPLDVRYAYQLNGSRSLGFVPRGGSSRWTISSNWPHPSFTGHFLPAERRVDAKGFSARYAISNIALGQALVLTSDPGEARLPEPGNSYAGMQPAAVEQNQSAVAAIDLVEPVDLYSQVDRAVKYGFLIIGFTFLTFLLFDLVAGARVAAAEYLLTGAGLVLFFVMLLAFAEVVGFAWAYIIASAAIIGLLTAYSGAVLGSRQRAAVVGAQLTGLYALLYILLNLEAYSLLIGSLLLFVALAGVMYATRRIDWSAKAPVAAPVETQA